MLSFLKSKTESDIVRLVENSENIVDVFTTTIISLNDVNSEIQKSIKERTEQIEALNRETEILNTLSTSNEKIILKLHSILN